MQLGIVSFFLLFFLLVLGLPETISLLNLCASLPFLLLHKLPLMFPPFVCLQQHFLSPSFFLDLLEMTFEVIEFIRDLFKL